MTERVECGYSPDSGDRILTIHPAIAAGVADNEEEARMLAEAAERLRYGGFVSDAGEALDLMRAAIAASRMADFEAMVREQMAVDRAANRTNRQAKRQRCKAARRQRLHAERRAKASRWLGSVPETLAGAREAMIAEGFRPCERCSMLTLSQPCAACLYDLAR